MSDPLYDKTEALLKGLLSIKSDSMRTAAVKGQGIKAPKLPSKLPDVKPPKIKGPSVPKISTTPSKPKGLPTSPEKAAEAVKVPGGLPPPSKKDPAKVAAQLARPDQTKLVAEAGKEEVLKVEKNGQWSLEKQDLDPNAGYKFSHEHHDLGGGNMLTRVNVHTPTGEHVGAATFAHQGSNIVPGTIAVDEGHQRKGIASAMYQQAEHHTGKKLLPSPNQTPEGAALWSGNKAKPKFG